jgi:hypothetical protein
VLELAAYASDCEVEFQQLERMVDDQTQDGKLKPRQFIRPDSLQNPSDEDATFRRKAGKNHKGYVANIVEECGEQGNIITNYDYDVNLCSDVEFGARTIEELGVLSERSVLISDGAYGSVENFAAAEANNIELVTSALTGKEPPRIINEFEIEDKITRCPAGLSPTASIYDAKTECFRAHFDRDTCQACPRLGECPAVLQKKRAVIRLTKSTLHRATYIVKLATEEYQTYTRKRNGVEGIPSVLRRCYGVDTIPVRGLLRTKIWFSFKIGAINAKRVIKAAFSSLLSISFPAMSCFKSGIQHSQLVLFGNRGWLPNPA